MKLDLLPCGAGLHPPAGLSTRPLLIVALLLGPVSAAPKQPVYVGARACAACHSGPAMGNIYSKWLHSKHSSAYAALSKPESKQMAQISGLRQDPEKAPVCLGCHATAAAAEEWERDDDFRIEDGIQCETCHGPGSEYMTEAVMRNRAEAVKAGLRFPDEKFCFGCHIEKGSHVAVLPRTPKYEVQKARETIAHPLPKTGRAVGKLPAFPAAAKPSEHQYVGDAVCGNCHKGPQFGHQHSKWRMGPHSKAWSVLSTPSAYEQAVKNGIQGDPQHAPQCLKCHTTGYGESHAASSTVDQGVTCEACHGPGSHYAVEGVMRDRTAALKAGLRLPNESTCRTCHTGAGFHFAEAVKQIAHPTKLPGVAAEPSYKNPVRMAMRPDGKELWIACEAADSVAVVDVKTREKIAEIPVGGMPVDVAFTPDGTSAFVSNRHDDTVSQIDVASRKVLRTAGVGDEPHGLLTGKAGRLLYVANTSSADITVLEAAELKYVKTLSGSRGPWSMALSPDGGTLLLTNMLARFAPLRTPFVSEVTSIDTERGVVDNRIVVDGANLMMGVAWHPSGRFALATLNRTKSLIPMTRLVQGWTITNGLAVLWRDGAVDQVLLDEPNLGFSDMGSVAFTPDGRYALATSGGTDRVAVIDVAKLTATLLSATKQDRERVIPNHLGYASRFVVRYIPVQRNPRAVLIPHSGAVAYVANTLDDSVSVIDLRRMAVVSRIDLGGPREITRKRLGERLFHDAKITFRRQYSCSSCHPDGHVDSVTYDIESDGIGVSPVDNRTLRGILDTAPFKWEGTNPSLSRQCGARLSVFFTRLLPFTPDELAAVDLYVTTIERPPNRHRTPGAPMTPAQRRGKTLFERTTTADGRAIPPGNRCVTCHFPPYFTDRQVHDVGTRQPNDRTGRFDTPHLNNIYDSAPYLHNGMAATLEEIWTVYNPDDRHGVTNDMTKDQLNDLIEYLKTL